MQTSRRKAGFLRLAQWIAEIAGIAVIARDRKGKIYHGGTETRRRTGRKIG